MLKNSQPWDLRLRIGRATFFWQSIPRGKQIITLLLSFLLLCSLMYSETLAQTSENEEYRIHFKTGGFIPPPKAEIGAIKTQWAEQTDIVLSQQDVKSFLDNLNMENAVFLPTLLGAPSEGKIHFLVQFETLPDFDDQQFFSRQGITLLTYVTGNAYIASAGISRLDDVQNLPGVRWVGPLRTDDKIGLNLKAGIIGSWAQTSDGREVLTIQFHQDVNLAQDKSLVAYFGGAVVGIAAKIPAITAIFPPGQAEKIAQQDIVQYVDIVDLPLEDHNDGARAAANITPLAQAPYSLTGAGVTVLVYDSGIVDVTHPDFGTRVIETDGDTTETIRDHSTHVAGTVGGSGVNSTGVDSAGNPNNGTAGQWAGMAPAVNIRSFGSSGSADVLYDSSGDLNGDFTTAINNGVDLATMSQGNNVVPNGFPCSQLGDYTNTAILIDNIVIGSIAGQQLIYFESVGNERGGSLAACGITFSTISSPATAKNSIAVGAINSNDNTMTGFSSFGPTDDGRLKPDITAPGCQSSGDFNITSPSFIDLDPDGPGPMTPNGNLDPGEVQNAYVGKCGTSMATPVAAGATALLIEQWRSTRGAGTRPLPHTVKAILVHTATDRGNPGPDYQFGWGSLNAQAAVDLVIADDTANLLHVDQVDNDETDFYTFNSDGTTNIQITLAWDDPPAARLAATTLINDLDLRLIDPDGIVYQPFTLNPATPGTAAGTGNDTTNNVEMVIGTAKSGTWTVSVAGTAVPSGPQQYTLVTPLDATLNRPPVANANGPYNTDEGSNVPLNGSGSDPDGDTLSFAWDFNYDGIAFNIDATGQTPDFDLVGQDGVFTVVLRVTDMNGAFDIDQTTVTVNNLPPDVNMNSDSPKDEGDAVTVTGTIADPGWLEMLTATIDWDDGSPPEAVYGTLENFRPDATLTFNISHTYGDNGIFRVEVCASDDDSTTCEVTALQIDNVNPTAAIDTTGTTLVNGKPTFLAHMGDPIDFNANSQDPGSDDLFLSWDWDDGLPSPDVTTPYLVNPPDPDPFPSPSIQPREITDNQTHAFSDACFYEVGFLADDDDGGYNKDNASVIISGNASRTRLEGYWQHQYSGNGNIDFDQATLECYLAITGFMSTVFDEIRDASTIEKAYDVLFVGQNGGSAAEQFDRELLTVWLNFANGAIEYPDFMDIVIIAENVRLDPTATDRDLRDQTRILHQINNGG